RAELGPDEDRGPPFLAALPLPIAPIGTEVLAGPRRQCRENDLVLLMRLLHARGSEVLEDHLVEATLGAEPVSRLSYPIDQLVVFIHTEYPVRRQTLDRERTGDTDFSLVLVGFVVEVLELSLAFNRRVDLLLARDPGRPPLGMDLLGRFGPLGF